MVKDMLRFCIILSIVLLFIPNYGLAKNLVFSLIDDKQKPLANAVVYAIPLNNVLG